jgi:cytochrome c oxidase subunit IV
MWSAVDGPRSAATKRSIFATGNSQLAIKMAHTDTHAHAHDDHGHGPVQPMHVHAVPLWLLTLIFAILMFLTLVTVAVTKFDFGYQLNLLIALGIAVVKGALVGLYFMHLRWDTPFNIMAFCGSLVFVGLFIFFAILDTGEYKPNFEPPGGMVPDKIAVEAGK